MSVNQLESNLEVITMILTHLKEQKDVDEEFIKSLEKERDLILKKLNIL